MLSVYLEKPGDISIRQCPPPTVPTGHALLRIRAAGICGSDIGAFRGTNPLVSYPRVIGHELAGEVVEIGPNEKGIKPGDRVVVDPYLYCGHCYPCSLGRTNCCTSLQVLGVQANGGMQTLFAHPAHLLVPLPDSIPWELAALAEPLTIALHGLHRGSLAPKEHVAISGAGPIGLLAGLAALHYGAIPILIDPVEQRLAAARQLGIPHTLPTGEGLVEQVSHITGGRMAEMSMEASGAEAAILQTLELTASAGRVVLTGWPKSDIPLPTATITRKELDVRGARTSAGEFEEALELIATGAVDMAAVLTRTVPAKQLPEMVRAISSAPGSYMKVVGLFDEADE